MDSQGGYSYGLKPPKTRLKSLWTAFVVPSPPSRRIFLVIFAGVLLPLVTVLIFSYREVDRHLTENTYVRRAAIAELAETSVKERLDRFVYLGESFAGRPGVLDSVAEGRWDVAADTYLIPSVDNFPEVDRLLLVNPDGVLMSDWPQVEAVQGKNFSFREWFQGVSTTQGTYVSGVYRRTAEPAVNVVAVAVPLLELGDEKKVLGYLVLQIKTDTFLAWSEEVDAGEGAAIYVVDQFGYVVSHPAYAPQGEIIDYSSLGTVQKLKKGQDGEEIVYNPIEQVEQLVAYEHVPTYGWGVVVTQPTQQAFANRDMVLQDLLFLYGALTILIAAFSIMALWLFARMRSYAFTTAKKMNQSLSERQAQLNEAEELAKLGSWKWDLEKNTVSCSAEMHRLFGMDNQVITDPVKTCSSVALPQYEPKIVKAYARTLKTGKALIEFQVKRESDGVVRWMRWQTRAKFNPAGKASEVTGIVQDITMEKELEEAKSEFATLAAHQLRTPLSIINWMSELLMTDKADPLTSKQKVYIQDIFSTNKRLVKLVNTLLTISRVEMGTFTLRLEEVSLKKTCDGVLKEYQPQIQAKHLDVEIKYSKGVDKILGDENLVTIILSNLISNAISYTPPRGKVNILFQKDAHRLVFSIKDTGVGIPKDIQDKIFTKFFRAANAKQVKPEGTGLGLFMVKSLVEEQGNGKVWFESEEGKGSVFYVSLPILKGKKGK